MENYNKSIIEKFDDGSISCEEYFLNGIKHRLDGPAHVQYYDVGRKWIISYFVNGFYHRLDGPAHMSYNYYGNLKSEIYCLFGKQITKEEFNTPGFIDAFILENS